MNISIMKNKIIFSDGNVQLKEYYSKKEVTIFQIIKYYIKYKIGR
jgi:hypothetical protein